MIPWDNEAGFYRALEDFLGARARLNPFTVKGGRHGCQRLRNDSRLEAGAHIVETGAWPDRHGAHERVDASADLACALTPPPTMGAIVNRLDLPPVNGEKVAQPRLPRLSRHHAADRQPGRHRRAEGERPGARPDDAAVLARAARDSARGTKILLAVEPPEVLARMVPTEDDRKRVQGRRGAAARSAKEMQVTSDAGTDLRCALGRVPGDQRIRLRR